MEISSIPGQVWDEEKYAYVSTTEFKRNETTQLWKRILIRIVGAFCILRGDACVTYTNSHHKYYKKNDVQKLEVITYYNRPEKQQE